MQASRDIPDRIKRRLRQEAGFGCCRCGFPFVEYHHIVPWSVVQEHNPNNMMALCPNCHSMVTAGAVTETEQRGWKTNPYNVQQGRAEGVLKLDQGQESIKVGTTTFSGNVHLLWVDDVPLLSLLLDEEHRLFISLAVFDSEENLLLRIDRNEWRAGNSSVWNVEYRYKYLKVQRVNREVTLEVDARGGSINVRAELWCCGTKVSLGSDKVWDILVTGNGFSWGMSPGMKAHNCGICVDTGTGQAGIGLGVVTRP